MVRSDGTLVAHSGDIDRPYFLRSSAKPFQAHVSQSSGAGLRPVELAIVSASHRGHPVHVSLVESMLEDAGLDERHLQCPPGWPLATEAERRLIAAGATEPRRVWHNCSGKHTGFLRACLAQGWPTESYLHPQHPLQRRVVELLSELGSYSAEPVGVDGCGAPVHRTTTRVMALLFARLGSDRSLAGVFDAMHTYPALVAGNGEADSAIGTAVNGVAKGGAEGCLGVGLASGLGVAVKSWDGIGSIANIGAVAALDSLGLIPPPGRDLLASFHSPVVYGGAREVGRAEPRLVLEME